MKLTKTQLKAMIKEELSNMNEVNDDTLKKVKSLAAKLGFKQIDRNQAKMYSKQVDSDFLIGFLKDSPSWVMIDKDGTALSWNASNEMSGTDEVEDFTDPSHWRRVFK
jgi:hypothetical protein